MSKSNLIVPDFTEDIVGFMIQSILTITRFPKAPFALVPLSKKDEVIYGADALIDSVSPIYIFNSKDLLHIPPVVLQILLRKERS